MVTLMNRDTGDAVVRGLMVRDGFWGRLTGYLLRSRPRGGEAMLLTGTSRVHTVMMRFDLDLYYLDGALRVLETRFQVRPWRFPQPPPGCRHVLEAPSPPLGEALPIVPGDRLSILWDSQP